MHHKFSEAMIGKRAIIACKMARQGILVDVVSVDYDAHMMQVTTVHPAGTEQERQPWWIALDYLATIAVVPSDTTAPSSNGRIETPSGIVIM